MFCIRSISHHKFFNCLFCGFSNTFPLHMLLTLVGFSFRSIYRFGFRILRFETHFSFVPFTLVISIWLCVDRSRMTLSHSLFLSFYDVVVMNAIIVCWRASYSLILKHANHSLVHTENAVLKIIRPIDIDIE